jgi:hypothetical protein
MRFSRGTNPQIMSDKSDLATVAISEAASVDLARVFGPLARPAREAEKSGKIEVRGKHAPRVVTVVTKPTGGGNV